MFRVPEGHVKFKGRRYYYAQDLDWMDPPALILFTGITFLEICGIEMVHQSADWTTYLQRSAICRSVNLTFLLLKGLGK